MSMFLCVAANFGFMQARGNKQDLRSFHNAQELYQQRKFKKALKAYKSIQNKTAHVYFNMGNCAYKLHYFGHALWYWRIAEKQTGLWGKSTIRENIAVLKAKLSHFQDKGIIIRIASFIGDIPLFFLQLFFLFLWFFLFIQKKYTYRPNYLLVTVFFLVCNGAVLSARYLHEKSSYGVVVDDKIPVFSGPGANFQRIGQLAVAHEVKIKTNFSSFFLIYFPSSIFQTKPDQQPVYGWISKKHLKRI